MRTTVICLLLILIAVACYGYKRNPAGCVKLGNDLATDLSAIFVEAPVPSATAASEPPSTDDAGSTTATATQTPVTAPVSTPVAAVVQPLPPIKKWLPPSAIPAQPNWTWTTSDDKTYQNVVITKIEADTVSITHSMGVTHLDISTLPQDIQKQLNYDPDAAAAVKAEAQRQADHPYYTMAQMADAEAVARQTHRPLAWLCGSSDDLSAQNPNPDSDAGLTQRALLDLENRTIVIFEDGNGELSRLPNPIIAELFHLDDGPLPGGHHYYAPKIIFSSPDATRTFGRISNTQLKAGGFAEIKTMLASIQEDPDAQATLNGQPVSAPPAVAK